MGFNDMIYLISKGMVHMAINGEDLIQGNCYINCNHGICRYKDVSYLKAEDKTYYNFIFSGGDMLYVDDETLVNVTEYYGHCGLSKLGGSANWKDKYDKNLIDFEIFTKTKKSLLQIEAYENILINGIENNKFLLDQCSKKNYSNDREFNDFIESILQNSTYPKGYNKNIEVEYESSSKTAIINYRIPNTVEVPKIIKYKFDSLFAKLIEADCYPYSGHFLTNAN